MKWTVDLQAAEILSRAGHEWRQVDITPAQIDVAESGKNLARPKPLDTSLVADYAQAMRADATFPMIVVAKLPGVSKLVIVGGNHRFHAAIEANGKSVAIRAMMVELAKHDFWLLAKALNVTNGKREDRSTRAEQAVELVKNHSMTVPQAANAMGVEASAVRYRLQLDDLRRAMVRYGATGKEPPQDMAGSLCEWLEDEDTRAATVQLLKCNADRETLKNVRQQVRAAKSGKARAEAIQLIADQISSAPKSGRRSVGPRSQVLRAVSMLDRFLLQHKTLDSLQMSTKDAVSVLKQLADICMTIACLPGVEQQIESRRQLSGEEKENISAALARLTAFRLPAPLQSKTGKAGG